MEVNEVRLMYWAYYIAGGIYTTEEFSSRFKWYWFAVNLGIACAVAAGGIGYCVTVTSFNSLDSAIVLSHSVAATCFPIIVALVTWYCRSDLKKLLHFIEQKSDAANRCNKSFYRSRVLLWTVLAFTLGMAMLIIPAVDHLLTSEADTLTGRERFHTTGVPFINQLTQHQYWAAYFVEFSLSGFLILTSCVEPLFILTVTFQLNDIALDYCTRLNALDKVDPSFDRKLISLIGEHRVLMSSIQLARSYLQIFSALMMPSLLQIITIQIFLFLEATPNAFLKVRLLVVASLGLLYLYPHCKFGTMMNEMQEEIVRNVYGLPWNDQPPRRRKTFYIFLTQVQRPLTFNAFRVIPIDMTLIPKILRINYSLANVLAARHH